MRYILLLVGLLALVACGSGNDTALDSGSEPVVENVVAVEEGVAPAGDNTPTNTTTNTQPQTEEVASPTDPPPPTATIETVADEPAPEPTAEPEPTSAPVVTAGRTADGGYFLGAENAPITLIDYSDFL